MVKFVPVNHEPFVIFGKQKNAALVAQSDWSDMTETFHLLSAPGMCQSIESGLLENQAVTSKESKWQCTSGSTQVKL
jgi:PHD/YefM family antitoxin component YafN of YafNO toxin-antitoxin module